MYPIAISLNGLIAKTSVSNHAYAWMAFIAGMVTTVLARVV